MSAEKLHVSFGKAKEKHQIEIDTLYVDDRGGRVALTKGSAVEIQIQNLGSFVANHAVNFPAIDGHGELYGPRFSGTVSRIYKEVENPEKPNKGKNFIILTLADGTESAPIPARSINFLSVRAA